jgi:hypothetical protein
MSDPLPSVADRIDRVGDVPFQVWPPLANSLNLTTRSRPARSAAAPGYS